MSREPVVPVLERAEWDFSFSMVPTQHLWRAWSYEFGRHVGWVREAFANATYFDSSGNWCYLRDWDGDGEHFLNFCVPPGFPELPFSKVLKKGATFPEYFQITGPRSVRELRGGGKIAGHERTHSLAIYWGRSNKTIVADFAKLLKEIRPVAAIEKRGRAEDKRFEADLRALGAFRLLRAGLTARQATALTRKVKGALYQDDPEWTVARKRALKVFRNEFGILPADIL